MPCPVAGWFCSRCCRWLNSLSWLISESGKLLAVTRIKSYGSSFQVHDGLKHFIHGGNQMRRGHIGLLELDQISHLLVEGDAADLVALALQHVLLNGLIADGIGAIALDLALR